MKAMNSGAYIFRPTFAHQDEVVDEIDEQAGRLQLRFDC